MGELDGFEAFYAAAYRRVVGQVFALLGDLQEAEDVTQDAFDATHGGGAECCLTLEWPSGSRQPVVLQIIYHADQRTRTYRLVYVDPATGAATPGAVLAVGDVYPQRFDFDASGRYLLFGNQDSHTVSTWWSRGGKPVRVARIEIGNEAPAGVAGAYTGGEW